MLEENVVSFVLDKLMWLFMPPAAWYIDRLVIFIFALKPIINLKKVDFVLTQLEFKSGF